MHFQDCHFVTAKDAERGAAEVPSAKPCRMDPKGGAYFLIRQPKTRETLQHDHFSSISARTQVRPLSNSASMVSEEEQYLRQNSLVTMYWLT
jgi:hypothetical protein